MSSSWWAILLDEPGVSMSIKLDLSLNISFSSANDSSSLSTEILLEPELERYRTIFI